jgi:hypothetical protein
MSPLGEDS